MQTSGEILGQKELRRAFGAFATGVTVVTVGGENPHGMTANSFTSVSLDPALVLICVGHNAVMHDKVLQNDSFGVSVLTEAQEPVARHFADNRRALGGAEFRGREWAPGRETGAPLLRGALATFECAVWRTYDGGDHSIFVGEILCADWLPEDEALLFAGGHFRRFAPHPQAIAS